MNILYVATSFPKPSIGATIYTDLAEALNQSGHHITVVVSEQAKNQKKSSFETERDIPVLRINTGNYYDVGFIEKGITTLLMPFKMKQGILKHIKDTIIDVVLFESPPVTNHQLVSWIKKKYHCSAYLMMKDIFPQNAVDLGVISEKSIVHRFFSWHEKRLYQTADVIGCMSQANLDYLYAHHPEINPKKIELFPNTKHISPLTKLEKNAVKSRYSLPTDRQVFLFGGNMGKPQYIDLLCHLIKACKDDPNLYFLFIGRGTEKKRLQEAITSEKIKNAQLIDNLPREDYEAIIKAADVGLIVLDPRFTIPNYPSRILSYMEYAIPVMAATDHVSDINDLISEAKCGAWVWSGDHDEVVKAVRELAKSVYLDQWGRNGREYLEKNLDVSRSVSILESHFN